MSAAKTPGRKKPTYGAKGSAANNNVYGDGREHFKDSKGRDLISSNEDMRAMTAALQHLLPGSRKNTPEGDEYRNPKEIEALVVEYKPLIQKINDKIEALSKDYSEQDEIFGGANPPQGLTRTKISPERVAELNAVLSRFTESRYPVLMKAIKDQGLTIPGQMTSQVGGEEGSSQEETPSQEDEGEEEEEDEEEEEEEEESTPTTQVLVPTGDDAAATVATVTDPNLAGAVVAKLAGKTEQAAAKVSEEEEEILVSIKDKSGNFLEDEAFILNDQGNLITVTPKDTYAPYKEKKDQIDLIAMFMERYARDKVANEGTDVQSALVDALSHREGLEKLSFEEALENYAFVFQEPPPQPQPPLAPSGDPLNPTLPTAPLPTAVDPLDGSLNPGTAGSVPIGDTSLNPLADGEDGDEEQPTGPQGAIQAPPTKFKPRYHKESIKIFFGNDENPPWDLQLERSISELTWGKEGFNKAMNGLIEKHSMDFFIWEKKSDGTEEEFNEICQVYFCFLRQLQRGSRAPMANVPLSALLGFGNKLAQAAGGLGDATFSNTGGMAGGGGGFGDTTRTRPPPYGPFQGASPYNLPPGQKGGGPFSGKSPYEVPKGKQSNKSLRSMVKTAAMMEAEKLVRVPQNEAITRVVDAFDKRPMNWANKPLANEYIIEAAARLPRGNIEGGVDPKDPTGAFQYGIATPAAKAFNFKIRKPPVVKTVRNF